ncbi:hypothetical protein GWK47_002027 [Chionoecetes opilio]|uniref:Uncharacterized protein n=1 Tax=Chionoecetes opilio TaxID=41210 RepID=A0A8J5BYB3_CHIOP|nr:hypothetical protein GWK47_002027 [Chionoecetes opilio]
MEVEGADSLRVKLSDVANLYKTRLEQLGATVTNRIHTTRLKDRLLSVLPDLRAHSQGRDTLLLFEKDIGPTLKKACDHDSDAMHLVRAEQVVRREMFQTRFTFDGAFHADCQKDSVTPSLLALVNMILDGVNIKHQTKLANTSTTTAALTVSQLLVFNSVKHARSVESTSVRHSRERETPNPLYLSLKIHAVTRSRGLIDTLFSLGMCVSYDRLLQLTADIANGVCQHFNMEEVVCPPKLRKGLFTTGAVDNIDHNPSSATAKDSFHGTGISLMQHPSHTNGGLDRGVVVIGEDISSAKFLAERNTSLQRANHDLTLQVHDLRTGLGLPLSPTTPEKLGKVGGMMMGGITSPRVMSPTLGAPSRVMPYPSASYPHLLDADTRFDDIMSTCSSEGSGGGSHVPGPDLPGAAQLDRLAQLADSLLAASRNISRVSGLMRSHGASKLTSASSLDNLTSMGALDHRRFLISKRTSASVGNLTALSPIEQKDKATHLFSRLGSCASPGPFLGRGDFIVAAPVREKKGSQRIFGNHSIEEEVEQEEMSRCEADSLTSPSCSDTTKNAEGASLNFPKPFKTTHNTYSVSLPRKVLSATNIPHTKTTTASQTVTPPTPNENSRRLSRGTSA